ncbi:hypothetical protein Taro_006604 [Colocasia esculenta]|uniref:Phosphorylated adapter RNA export protein n=1 Tax=Colocasia esculenta TaxID=4460 RepID=A0A843TRL6_COLES|nr:hypothetical protein [Colocasia esculenta]
MSWEPYKYGALSPDSYACPACFMAAPASAPAEKSVLETIFEDGEALGDDGSLSEDVEMVDAETLDDGSDHDLPDRSSNAAQTPAGGGGGEAVGGEPRRGGSDGAKTRKKKRKKNRKKRMPPSDMRITDINRFVIDTCRHLREKKSYLVWSAVGCLGVTAVNDLVKEVDAIQSCGGQKTADGKRLRTGGGILWNILKAREPKSYKEIMAKGRQFEKQFRPHKTVDVRKGNGPTMFPTSPCETEGSVGRELDDSQPPEELPPVTEPSNSKGDRKSVLNRIRAPVAYDDLIEEGEIV